MSSSYKHAAPLAGMGQPNSATCWDASYRMLYTYLRRDPNSILDTLRAFSIDVDDAQENGLADINYQRAATALGLQCWPGRAFNLPPGTFDWGLSDGAESFLSELEKGPLWVSRISGRGYHAVLATGYDDGDRKIVYNNPFPGPSSAIEQPLDANLFVRNITSALGSVQAWRYRIS